MVVNGASTVLGGLDGGQGRFFQRVCHDLAKRNELTPALARRLEAALARNVDDIVCVADAAS